jgi:hypothetical protein
MQRIGQAMFRTRTSESGLSDVSVKTMGFAKGLTHPWRAARLVPAVALLLLTLSCARQQSIELSVDRAELTNGFTGNPAMEVYLNSKSADEFGVFTSRLIGHSVEMRFQNVVLTKTVLRTPVLKGILQVSVLPDHVDGTLNESNAAEIARKLSASDAKLEIRVAD